MIAKYDTREDDAPPLHFFCWLLLLLLLSTVEDCAALKKPLMRVRFQQG
jgi:hypothetical protein